VLSFVLDAVRAEAFNEKRTLFLFGSYTIGKEKLFLEVARTIKQKVHCCRDGFLVCALPSGWQVCFVQGCFLLLDALLKPLYMVTAIRKLGSCLLGWLWHE